MLTEAFVGEVVDRIEHEGARDVARTWVAGRLGGDRMTFDPNAVPA